MVGLYTFKVAVTKIIFDDVASRGDIFKDGQDTDWLDLHATVSANGDPRTPEFRTVSAYRLGDNIRSGNVMTGFNPPIELPDVIVSDTTGVILDCTIVNRGHDDTLVKALVDSGTLIVALGMIVGFLGGINKVAIAVKEGGWEMAIGGFIAGLGGLGAKLGILAPDCDGSVFGPKTFPFITTAKDLLTATGGVMNQPVALPLLEDSKPATGDCHGPKTRVELTVTLISAQPDVPDFGQDPHPQPMPGQPSPRSGVPLHLWDGTWVDNRFPETSRIHCTLSAQPAANDGDLAGMLAQAHVLAPVADTFGGDPLKLGATRSTAIATPAAAVAAGGAAGAQGPSSIPWHPPQGSVTVTEYLGQPFGRVLYQANVGNLLASPMLASSFHGAIYPSEAGQVAKGPPGGVVAGPPGGVVAGPPGGVVAGPPITAPPIRLNLSASLGEVAPSHGPSLPPAIRNQVPFADTLLLGNGAILQLYGLNDRYGRLAEQRLRYRRVTPSGEVTTDAMLTRAEAMVR